MFGHRSTLQTNSRSVLERRPPSRACTSGPRTRLGVDFLCSASSWAKEASRPVQDPDLDSLRPRNPLQGYHWLGLVRRSCMTSGSATRWFRAWHCFPERELLPFRPLLQHRRLDGRPPVQGLLQRDCRSGSRSSVHCSDDPRPTPPPPPPSFSPPSIEVTRCPIRNGVRRTRSHSAAARRGRRLCAPTASRR